MQIPLGWTDAQTMLGYHDEGPALFLSAPAEYGSNKVTLAWGNLLGPRPGSSSRQELQLYVDTAVKPVNNAKVIHPVTDCTVAGDPAAFVELQTGTYVEYRVYVLHPPDRPYPYVWVVAIQGIGGIDDRSMLDAKRLMGSWTWER